MNHSERDIGRMGDQRNDRLLNEYLDDQAAQEQREEAIDAYVHENMNDRILAWLDEAAEGVLFECVSETSAEEVADKLAARTVRSIAAGEDTDANYWLLGHSFYTWMRNGMEGALEPELRDEAEKGLGQ